MKTSTPRELHLIDIENLLGTPHFSAAQVAQFRDFYLAHNSVAENAHVVIATSSEEGLLEAGIAWPESRKLFRHGHDGADLALLEVLTDEDAVNRFTKIVIASGDGIFADIADELYDEGIAIEIFSRADCVSTHFTHPAETVHLFGALDFTLAA